jgi:hypothetical protein
MPHQVRETGLDPGVIGDPSNTRPTLLGSNGAPNPGQKTSPFSVHKSQTGFRLALQPDVDLLGFEFRQRDVPHPTTAASSPAEEVWP